MSSLWVNQNSVAIPTLIIIKKGPGVPLFHLLTLAAVGWRAREEGVLEDRVFVSASFALSSGELKSFIIRPRHFLYVRPYTEP